MVTSIAPWLTVRDTAAALDFYTAAFAATELHRHEEGGVVEVAHMDVDGADFWVQRDDNANPTGEPVRMILTVEDPDAVFASAVAAGATVIVPMYEGHGWRVSRVADPTGHHWEIGHPL